MAWCSAGTRSPGFEKTDFKMNPNLQRKRRPFFKLKKWLFKSDLLVNRAQKRAKR